MPNLAARAKQIAQRELAEDPGGLRTAAWSVEAVEMLLVEDLGVDVDVTMAAAWATATIGAGCWMDEGPGYEVDDVRRALGDQVARLVSWAEQDEWQSDDDYLRDLMEAGPVEARLIALARTVVATVSGPRVTERQAQRVMRLAMSIPALLPRVVAAAWPVVSGEA